MRRIRADTSASLAALNLHFIWCETTCVNNGQNSPWNLGKFWFEFYIIIISNLRNDFNLNNKMMIICLKISVLVSVKYALLVAAQIMSLLKFFWSPMTRDFLYIFWHPHYKIFPFVLKCWTHFNLPINKCRIQMSCNVRSGKYKYVWEPIK